MNSATTQACRLL